jgi:hypothetical protein
MIPDVSTPGRPEAGLYSSKTFRPVVQRFTVPEPVARALSRFANELRRIALFESAFRLLFLFQIAFTCSALLDRFLQMDDLTRIGVSVCAYAVVIGLGWRLLDSALRQRDPEDIALMIEQRATHVQFEERISTTVELARTEGACDGFSGKLVRRVAREAAALIHDLDVESLVDRRTLHRAIRFCAAAAMIVALLCVVPTLHMPLAYCRAFFPWMNLERPSSTQISVTTGNNRVVDGEAIEIQIHVAPTPSQNVFVETRQGGGDWQRVRMTRSPAENATFVTSLGPLHEKLQYRIRADDGLSAVYTVVVLPRPELTDFSLTVNYPRYTGLPPHTFDRINDSISVLKGSHIEAGLHANTRLSAAVMEFSDGRLVSMPVDNNAAKAAFDVGEDMAFRVRLRSTDEVGNPDAPLFSIHATLDLPPHVTVLKPEPDSSAEFNATIPLEARGEDDYGISSMRLIVNADQGRDAAVVPMERPADGGKVWMVSQAWDLSTLFLNSGETLTYRIEAVDSAGAVGSSEERRLKIASGPGIEQNLLLPELNNAQNSLTAARKILDAARQETSDFAQVFRPEDVDFQSAERALLAEGLETAAHEIRRASSAIENGLPHAEAGALHTVLQGASEGLQRFAERTMRPLQRSAGRAHSTNAVTIKAGLDALAELLPNAESELENLHEALTAAQRYAEACVLEKRATEIRDQQARILPVLLGSAGWTPKGTVFPGLLAEYFKGSRFQTMVRRTIDSQLSMKNDKLPESGTEGTSVRWSGQMFAPQSGQYVFRTSDGTRLSLAGKRLIDRWDVEIIDDAEKDFSSTGDWSIASAPGQCYQRVFHYVAAGKGAHIATWSFSGLLPGEYRVAATWMPFFNRATDAPYTILEGTKTLATVRVDQQAAPADFFDAGVGWKNLGDRIQIASGKLSVQLSDNANQYVIADAIRLERIATADRAACEGAIDLTEGWHDIVIEFHNRDHAQDFVLERIGPGSKGGIPTEQLRTPGMPAVSSDPRVRACMAKAASPSSVESAFATLQNVIDAARELPHRLQAIAVLPPRPDAQGEREGSEWSRAVAGQVVELDGARVLTPILVTPLLQWSDQAPAWIKNYSDVRERYRAALNQWSTKLVSNAFAVSSRLRQLQRDANAAEKAFSELVRTSKQPADPRREKAMARADAIVRVIGEDLRSQFDDVVAELRQTANDIHRSAEERKLSEALAQRSEAMTREAAANLERRLNDFKTPDALARSEQNQANLGSDAAALQKSAGELAEMAERGERTMQLRDALQDCTRSDTAAADTLGRPPSPSAAVAQQQAAAELKRSATELQQAIAAQGEQAGAPYNAIAQDPVEMKAIDTLNQTAADTLTGEITKNSDAVRQETIKELKKHANTARDAEKTINQELLAMAQNWAGNTTAAPVLPADQPKSAAEQAADVALKLHQQAERNRKATEYIERAKSLEEHAREKLKHDAPTVAQALRATGRDAEAASKDQKNPASGTLAVAEKVFTKAAQSNDDIAKRTDTLPLKQLADQLSTASQEIEKAAGEIAGNLGKPEESSTQVTQKIGQQARGFAGWDADRAAELRRAARAEELARENAQETNGSRAELEKQVLAELDALDKQLKGKLDQSIAAAIRKSAGEDGKAAKASDNLEMLAKGARNGAENLEQMAARMEKIAANAGGSASSGAHDSKTDMKQKGDSPDSKLVAAPPPGVPVDKSTWNRLPDDLRRDLLNAAGGRFPAEYELSIRRYFKNVAASQQQNP